MKPYLYFVTLFAFVFSACGKPLPTGTYYLIANTPSVPLYEKNVETLLHSVSLPRGTKVEIYPEQQIQHNDTTYFPVSIGENTYYIAELNLSADSLNLIQETQITIRTATSLITDTLTSKIGGLAQSDSTYQVLGYDYLCPDGTVHRYKVRIGNTEGYIYSKYTTMIPALGLPNDSIHARVRNPFGGGKASGCDFYAVKKPTFPNNPMPETCYSLYLNFSPAVIGKIDEYIALAKETKINTFVLDIKDNQCPGYKAEAMRLYSPTNYKKAGAKKEEMYRYAVQRLHEEGFYVVARITCFKDSYFVADHPECAITRKDTGEPFFHNKAYWPSAYDRRVWQFNVELAKEVVRKFGFNEVNFDYVRFPDKIYSKEDSINYHNRYNESKVQAIQRFVQYACDEIHNVGAYVSIDVFGETTNKGYTTPYGQYWPAISNVADVICGMPYPDHFADGYGGISKPWNNPYQTLLTWGKKAVQRQSETPTPAKVRTWVQAYPVMKHIDKNGIRYNAQELAQEIRGLYDAGLTDGYITWLASSSLERYTSQKKAFALDYLNDTTTILLPDTLTAYSSTLVESSAHHPQ